MSELHVVGARSKRKILKPVTVDQIQRDLIERKDGSLFESKHALISAFLPPSIKAVFAELEAEIVALCGPRYSRSGEVSRWGAQTGSIVLGNQRVSISRPRIRSPGGEIELPTYTRFQNPHLFDEQVFSQGIKRVSQRDYQEGLPMVAASFGVSKSSISRKWIKTTEKQVEKLLNRDLRSLDILVVFIDGKRFSKHGVVVALGVGSDGRKHVLGIYNSSTENSAACLALLADLERRGLAERDLLFVVDGGGGLNKALREKYDVENAGSRRAVRIRCFVHKWRNIADVLGEKGQQEAAPLFWAVREAKDVVEAQACSTALEACLRRLNASALSSYLEAKEDLLMIHRLKLGSQLKKFFSTTNPIESLNSLLEEDLRRVKRWRNSEHFQRWLACACLKNEKRMRRIRGYKSLLELTRFSGHMTSLNKRSIGVYNVKETSTIYPRV